MKLTQDKLQTIIEETMALFDRAPSISATIWDGEAVTSAARGFSNVDAGTLASPDTLYCIGSSSKAFTTTAICILVDQGKIGLDEPVRKYMPDLKMYDEATSESITVRDILCHRSGLPRYYLSLMLNPELTHSEMVRLIEGQQPKAPLRYRFGYSNYMFMLAATLVERVSGDSFDSFVKTHILDPLGMDSTFLYADQIPDENPRKSSPHEGRGERIKSIPRTSLRNSTGSGSIYSSTKDMIKWLQFQLHGDENVISAESHAEMHRAQMLIKRGEIVPWDFPETGLFAYGLGWFIQDYYDFTLYYHDGAVRGYRSMQLFVPKYDVAVSILTNCDATDLVFALGYKLADLLLDLPEIDWTSRFKEECRVFVGTEEPLLQKLEAERDGHSSQVTASDYTGVYKNPTQGTMIIEEKDGELFANIENNPSPLFYREEDSFTFVVSEIGFHCDLTFKRNADGKVDSIVFITEPELPDVLYCFTRL